MKPLQISQSQLVDILAARKGATFARLMTRTDARIPKRNNPLGVKYKLTDQVATLGANYGRAVVREGDRQKVDCSNWHSDRLPFGRYLVPRKVVTDNGKLYLVVMSTPGKRRVQPARIAYRTDKGAELAPSLVEPYLPAPSTSAKQAAHGLRDDIQFRLYAFDSITSIRIGGVRYALTMPLGLSSVPAQ